MTFARLEAQLFAALQRNVSALSGRRGVLEGVLRFARAERSAVAITGGDKPQVTITKEVPSSFDPAVRLLLSGIEGVIHGRFGQCSEVSGVTEWILTSLDIDVTVRATKDMDSPAITSSW